MPTKKVGSAGKFGPRYGMKLKKRWLEIDKKQRALHECPNCNRRAVRRISTGIWKCRKCGTTFVGGAYVPKTGVAKTVERIIRRLEEGET